MVSDDPHDTVREETELDSTLPKPADDEQSSPTRVADVATAGATRYELGAMLGAGGMGDVLLATDTQLGREVAVKQVRASASRALIDRFVYEARIQARLDHPAIPPVHEMWTGVDGLPRFAMKRLIGTSLQEILATHRLPRNRMLEAFVKVCLAIEFAHSRGVVHCDLKPANLMLGEFGEVYVLDWGLAKVVGDTDADTGPARPARLRAGSTNVSGIYGTPGYIAPERLRGEAGVTTLGDVYALGCILFEILAGERFRRGNRYQLLLGARERAPDPPSSRPGGRDVPVELDIACLAATASDPARRTPSARALGELVQRFLDGDRDIERRRQAAVAHTAAAVAAVSRSDGEVERQVAMREAGRALALDPERGDAAELIGRLMLQPPDSSPREVDDTLARLDDHALREHVRTAAWSYAGYLLAVPVLMVFGQSSPWVLGGVAALSVVAIIQIFSLRRQARVEQAHLMITLALSVVMIALLCWLFTPYLVGPGLAVAAIVGFGMHPRMGRIGVLLVVIASGVVIVLLLEATGVLPAMTAVEDGRLVLRSPVIAFALPYAPLIFGVYLVIVMATAGTVVRKIAINHRAAQRAIQLQAWHLRQLMPSADPVSNWEGARRRPPS